MFIFFLSHGVIRFSLPLPQVSFNKSCKRPFYRFLQWIKYYLAYESKAVFYAVIFDEIFETSTFTFFSFNMPPFLWLLYKIYPRNKKKGEKIFYTTNVCLACFFYEIEYIKITLYYIQKIYIKTVWSFPSVLVWRF